MSTKINISIPTPCHENWQDMAVADKGRFCASCRKHVIDFTNASDRQIAEAFKKESNLCGRFLPAQLQRDLIIPKEKSSLWMAASAAVLGFFGLGNNEIFAQAKKAETTQVEENKKSDTATHIESNRVVKGIVLDETGLGFYGVFVNIVGSTIAPIQTNIEGTFSVEVKQGDTVQFTTAGFETQRIIIGPNTDKIEVAMKIQLLGEVIIGNIFRKKDN
jgi:hypothetical protein